MLHRKKSSYLEDKLVKNSKNPVELRKILKPLCLHANKEIKKIFILIRMIQSSSKSKIHENANICKKLFSELGNNLVEKLPITSNKFTSDTTKDYYTYISRCFT